MSSDPTIYIIRHWTLTWAVAFSTFAYSKVTLDLNVVPQMLSWRVNRKFRKMFVAFFVKCLKFHYFTITTIKPLFIYIRGKFIKIEISNFDSFYNIIFLPYHLSDFLKAVSINFCKICAAFFVTLAFHRLNKRRTF